MPHPRAAWTAAGLILIVAAGTFLRMLPARDPAGMFLVDAAFNARMIAEVVAHGHVPARDSLSVAPAGRDVGALLPTGLYHAAALFHRAAAVFGARDLRWNILVFLSLVAALLALPVYGGAWALFRDRRAAALAAALAILVPAHLHRTYCFWLRSDGLGALLATTHVALALGAFAARSPRRASLLAAGSALVLFAGLAVWRVVLLLPLLEVAFVVLVVALRPPEAAVRRWFLLVVAAGTVASLVLENLRAQHFLSSRAWLAAVAVAGALFAPWLARARAPARLATIVVAAAFGWITGAWLTRGAEYVQVMGALPARILQLVGRHPVVDPLTQLSLAVEEMGAVRPQELWGPAYLSGLGLLFLASPLAYWLAAGRPAPRRLAALGAGPLLLVHLSLALGALTLLFARNKVLLAAPVCLAIGGLLPIVWPHRPPAVTRARAPSAAPGLPLRVLLGAWLLVGVALTARDAIGISLSRRSQLDPDYANALEFAARETPAGTPVLSLWERGFEIQTYTGHGTVLDGLLEDGENQRRIVGAARAFLSRRPDSLAALCRTLGVCDVLVPPSTGLYGVALLTGEPYLHKLVPPGEPLTSDEADRVLTRMMVFGDTVGPFTPVFRSGGFRVYRYALARSRP